MKNTLLTSLAVLSFAGLHAQPIMENHVPPFGSTFGLAKITSQMNKPTEGASQTWDYSGATLQNLASYTVIDPASLPASIKDSVPTATFAYRIEIGAPIDKAPYDFFSDQTTHYRKVGVKSSGSNPVETKNDTSILFNQTYNSTVSYGGMQRVYAGYGTLKVGAKTYQDIVMIKSYFASGSTDTLLQFHQFNPYYQMILSMAIASDTVANAIYWETTGGGTSGLNQLPESAVDCFPNPVKEELSVQLNHPYRTLSVSVFGSNGALMLNQESANTDHTRIPMNTLPKGLYLIRVQTEDGASTKKVVLE